MHILYVHQNFPAQFGHIARHLVRKHGWRCTFLTHSTAGEDEGIERITYKVRGGATAQNHWCSRTFENNVWHCDGVFNALKERADLRPDLIVGHSGFGSTLFAHDLYRDVPLLNLFEYYYRPRDPMNDMDFRKDLGWVPPVENYLRAYCRNAMILLDLQACDGGYTPTQFQRSRFPAEYQHKLQTIFDGVDRSIYHGHDDALRPPASSRSPRQVCGVHVPAGTRIVTYVSRGFESMRGFDLFMRGANRIARLYPDVLFFVVGSDQISYGGDENFIAPHKTFKQWTLAQEDFDLSRFVFTGRLSPADLGKLLASSDLHIYLTVPFVLSWSMMDAMSCGAVVLGSSTPPVQEMIRDGENGLLFDFYEVDELAARAVQVLSDPDAYRPLGRAAEQMIIDRYSLDAVLPRMLRLYEQAIAGELPRVPAAPTGPPPAHAADESIVTSVPMPEPPPFRS